MGIMEKKMETTVLIQGLYWGYIPNVCKIMAFILRGLGLLFYIITLGVWVVICSTGHSNL